MTSVIDFWLMFFDALLAFILNGFFYGLNRWQTLGIILNFALYLQPSA